MGGIKEVFFIVLIVAHIGILVLIPALGLVVLYSHQHRVLRTNLEWRPLQALFDEFLLLLIGQYRLRMRV